MTGKHPDLIVQQQEPFNAEPPSERLIASDVTPNEWFFVRNHAPVPTVDPHGYRLTVGGLVEKPLHLSLEALSQFPKFTVVATLACAGNRREDFLNVKPVLGEVPWGAQAISNAVWAGARLADVLSAARVQPQAGHVAFLGLDQVQQGAQPFGFGGSIPLRKALCEEVLLAYEMNGAALPPAHGFPLRAVVPGYIGARSVKWLKNIVVQAEPSDNYYQAHAYKLFAPHIEAATADWGRGLMLGELQVNSAICSPAPGATVRSGPLDVRGYAMAGGDRRVERVDVSVDGGRTWLDAELSGGGAFAWRLWRATVTLQPGSHELSARAWDSAAHTQPEDVEKLWNFKGYMNNAWPRVRIKAR